MTFEPGSYGLEKAFSRSWLSPGYWKTLAALRPDRTTLAIEGDSLRFENYLFEPASVFPTGTVSASHIAEINLERPTEVRLCNGEVLFVTHAGKAALLAFANQHDIAIKRRRSVWSALLDPFVDTSEDQGTIDAQFVWFETLGLSRAIVDAWRNEVAEAMIAYNFGTHLWEWCSLSLHDALCAQRAKLSKPAFHDFYRRAMRLTELDPTYQPGTDPGGTTLSDALHSVLIEWYPRDRAASKDVSNEVQAHFARARAFQESLEPALATAYAEPQRRYHTQAHIEFCLGVLNAHWNCAIDLNEVRWALIFHDAIYDPTRHDNEARSADWACQTMAALERPQDQQDRVRAMILATAHSGAPRTPDEALLLDIDLSILGADVETFDAYDRAIREEYSWVPEADYRSARARILQSFLERTRLYQTSPLRARYEAQARANLQRAIERLR